MLGPAPAVQSTVPPDAVREQVLGWSALKTGLLHRDRQDGDLFGAARAGPGERFPRAFTAGSQWAFWVTVGISVGAADRDGRPDPAGAAAARRGERGGGMAAT